MNEGSQCTAYHMALEILSSDVLAHPAQCFFLSEDFGLLSSVSSFSRTGTSVAGTKKRLIVYQESLV